MHKLKLPYACHIQDYINTSFLQLCRGSGGMFAPQKISQEAASGGLTIDS